MCTLCMIRESWHSGVTIRTEIMKKLGSAHPGKIVLVIDEISALTYDTFADTIQSCIAIPYSLTHRSS